MGETSQPIERLAGKFKGRNAGTAFGDFVWTAGVPDNRPADIEQQTRDLFGKLDRQLAALGSGKARILSASIHLANLGDKAVFDRVWDEWMGETPADWPQRTCVGAALVGDILVEIKLLAAR